MKNKSPSQCIQELVQKYGSKIYENSSFYCYLMNSLSGYQKLLKMLEFACNEKIPMILFAANEDNFDAKKIAIEEATEILIDKYCMQSEIAKQVVLFLSAGLGWNIPDSEIGTSSFSNENKQKRHFPSLYKSFHNKWSVLSNSQKKRFILISAVVFLVPILVFSGYKCMPLYQVGFVTRSFERNINTPSLEKMLEVEAKTHNPQIQFYIAERYKNMNDFEKSYYWAEKSASANNADGLARLAWFYLFGQVIEKNIDKGVELLKKSCELNSSYGHNLQGVMYENGKGVKQDYAKAKDLFEKSATQGNVLARLNLGSMYYFGNGVKQDYAMAKEWYEKSAAQGNGDAQSALGVMYYYGQGVEQDYAKAKELFENSAARGNSYAQFNLGAMYYDGKGVDSNLEKAKELWEKSAEQGNAEAQEWLEKMRKYELVYVPGGEVTLSTTPLNSQYSANIDSFYMGKYEVTQELWESIMGSNPSKFKGENNPVEYVSWYDAIYFCNKLSEKFGFTPVYAINGNTDVSKWNYIVNKGNAISGKIEQNTNASGFRLPTLEEWQYAAEGGQNYTYSGSNNLDEIGWYKDNSRNRTHPVAQKKPNRYGLYDMSGNVHEWVWDIAGYDGKHRWICGGGWDSDDYRCEALGVVSARYGGNNLGFRMCRTLGK